MHHIKHIHPAAFRGLLILEHLKLIHTQLHELPSLQHIGQSLTRLVVSRSAHFKGTYEGSLCDLRKIRYINMNHNGLRSTPLRLNLIANTIMTLEFSCNAINSMTSMDGLQFIKLTRLDLRHNTLHIYTRISYHSTSAIFESCGKPVDFTCRRHSVFMGQFIFRT